MLNFFMMSLFAFVVFGSGVVIGAALVTVNERKKLAKLKRIAIAGLGTVCVLGYSEDESLVDLIHEKFLGDKFPSEVDQEFLDQHTFSVPTVQFVTQIADTSFLRAAQMDTSSVDDA